MRSAYFLAAAVYVNCPACGTGQTDPKEGSYMWEPAQLDGEMLCQNPRCVARFALGTRRNAKIQR